MMIDVSIATVYSEVYFDYFLSFFSFPLPILLCACFDEVCFLEQNHIFFDDVIVSCMTAVLGFKIAASKFRMAGL